MRLNIKKMEHLECGPQTDGTISVDGQPLNKVNHFKYLWSVVTSDCDTLPDVRARINAAWMKWQQVTGVLFDNRMPIYLKAKIYKLVVHLVALYGSECWPATTKHEQAMNTMEMKMLRWLLGLTRLYSLTNKHIRKRWGVAPITDQMRESRLRWYGHVVHSEEESMARRALRMDPGGNRPRWRPKKRWMDTVAQDMKTINISSEDALDRVVAREALAARLLIYRAPCLNVDEAAVRQAHRIPCSLLPPLGQLGWRHDGGVQGKHLTVRHVWGQC
ncbi:hypothetical protein SRHO_G00270180 [Serrasalmus rhombeus]